MAIYNIQTEIAYNLPNATWKTFNTDYYYMNNKDSYFFDTNLPSSNIPSSFSNDRFVNSSKIVSSDDNENNYINNTIKTNRLTNLRLYQDDIWKAKPGFRIIQ